MTDRRRNPPMPWEQYLDEAYRRAASLFAKVTLASLLIAGILFPWKHWAACLPFVALFLAGAWVLADRREQ